MKNKKLFVLLAFMGIMFIPLSMIPAQVMNYLTGLLTGDVSGLKIGQIIPYVIFFFLAAVGAAGLKILRQTMSGVYLENAIEQRSLSLYHKVARTSPNFFRDNEPAKISNRVIGESRAIESFYLDLKIGLPTTIFGLLVFTIVLYTGLDQDTPLIGAFLPEGFSQAGNWFLATMILLMAPLHAFFLLFDKKLQNVMFSAREANDDLFNRSVESLSNIREYRNHFAFSYLVDRMRGVLYRIKHVEINILKLQSTFRGMPNVIHGVTNSILLVLGACLCISDFQIPLLGWEVKQIQWKDYMGFTGMAVVVYAYIGELSDYILNWRMNRESIRRVQELENLPQVFVENDQEIKQSDIVFEKVNFTTSTGLKILDNVNLEIKKGAKVAFVGPSGCGKSTTMNLLIREISANPGKVAIGEDDIARTDFLSHSKQVAMVQQKASILDTSLRNNILLGLRRPSSTTIDDDGSVDISQFTGCTTIDDLNNELIKVVNDVGLGKDMIYKALESKLSDKHFDSGTLIKIKELKAACAKELGNLDCELIEPFLHDTLFLEASLCENLLFGVYEEELVKGPIGLKRQVILKSIQELPIFQTLVEVGYKLYKDDQQIALSLRVQARRLHDILDNYPETEELSISTKDSEFKNMIAKLPDKFKAILVDICLDSSLLKMTKYLDLKEYSEILIQSRKKLIPQLQSAIQLISFDSDEISLHLPLKEYLIGGKVNHQRTDSRRKINHLIEQKYHELELSGLLLLIGLDSEAGENGANLSGGQAMKVVLGRIFLKQADVLLLDEATAALDEKSQSQIVKLIESDYNDKTVVSISHRLSTIKDYDKIIVFDRGSVVQEGTYSELEGQEGLFKELLYREENKEIKESKEKKTDIKSLISQSPLFSGLTSDEVALLERVSDAQICPKGETLFERGDEGQNYYFIIKGQAEFYMREDGDIKIIDEFGPGKSFGELALFGQGVRTLSVRAKEELTLCVIQKQDLEKILVSCPQIALKLLGQIANQVASLRNQLYDS